MNHFINLYDRFRTMETDPSTASDPIKRMFICDGRLTRKMWVRRLCLTSIIIVMISGCGSYSNVTVNKGRPIDENKIKQIVLGKTTRSDVFDLLGTPHSMFQGQVEFKNAELIGLYLHVENRYLTSLDDRHYAMLYRFSKSLSETIGIFTIVIVTRDTQISLKLDELLVLINIESNIVEDVAYRKET